MSRIRRHFSYANVMATLAVFIALGGTALAGVLISSNRQVGRGTISGHNPPPGAHPNLIGGSVGATDLSSKLKASLKVRCPADMRQAGELCFEDSTRTDASPETALKTCSLARRRLPTLAEMAVVFENSGAPQPNQWVATQWTEGDPYGLGGGTLGEDSSRQYVYGAGGATPSYKAPYRCVASPTN
ncbi:MAG: hypothetical protein U0R52_10030 [Solirubrobacterales bacterium]